MFHSAKSRLHVFIEANPLLIKLYKNAGILFGGNAVSAFLGLIALSILARSLGPENFGLYALLTAYIALIDRLVSFQTWQALIHYGAKALQGGQHERLSSLFVFGWLLDLGSGLAGTILALGGAYFLSSYFGIASVPISVIWIAVSVLFFNWVSTPTAVLRLYDKFSHQAVYLNLSAALKLIGYLLLWLGGYREIQHYIAVWAVCTVIGRLYLFGMAWAVAARNGLLKHAHINLPLMIRETPGIWHFVLTTNLDGIVRILRDVDIFIVNSVLGPSGAGLYRIARDLARIPTQLTGPFYQAIYPDLSRLAANRQFSDFIRLMRQSSFSLGLIVSMGWLVFVLAGKWIIALAFGEIYVPAYIASIWCMGAVMIWAFAQPLSPAMLSLGKVRINLAVHFFTSFAYLLMLWFTVNAFGLTGAGVALFLFYALWSSSMLVFFLRSMRSAKSDGI